MYIPPSGGLYAALLLHQDKLDHVAVVSLTGQEPLTFRQLDAKACALAQALLTRIQTISQIKSNINIHINEKLGLPIKTNINTSKTPQQQQALPITSDVDTCITEKSQQQDLKQKHDVPPVVIVALESSDTLLICYLAILRAGLVFSPVPATSSDAALDELAEWTGAALILRRNDIEQLLRSADTSKLPPLESLAPNTPVHLIFTSGTSGGKPKAVLCDQWGSLLSHHARSQLVPFQHNDITACNLFGIWDCCWALFSASPVVMLPDAALLDPALLANFLEISAATRMMLTPSLVAELVASTCTNVLGRLNVITLCGELARPSLIKQTLPHMLGPNAGVVDLYSSSECHDIGLSVSTLVSGVPSHITLLNHVYAYVIDQNMEQLGVQQGEKDVGVQQDYNNDIAEQRVGHSDVGSLVHRRQPNKEGILHLGGPSVALCYFNNDTQTKEAFKLDPLHDQRTFNTQDLGMLDSTMRHLRLRGRASAAEFIKVRGTRVSKPECEAAVLGVLELKASACHVFPACFDSNCVGDMDDGTGSFTDLVACVVLWDEYGDGVNNNNNNKKKKKKKKEKKKSSNNNDNDNDDNNDNKDKNVNNNNNNNNNNNINDTRPVMLDNNLGALARQKMRDSMALVPSYFICFNRFPTKPASGKLNQTKLRADALKLIQSVASKPSTNGDSIQTFENVLKLFRQEARSPNMQTDDGFFQHGGHSLGLVRLVGQLNMIVSAGNKIDNNDNDNDNDNNNNNNNNNSKPLTVHGILSSSSNGDITPMSAWKMIEYILTSESDENSTQPSNYSHPSAAVTTTELLADASLDPHATFRHRNILSAKYNYTSTQTGGLAPNDNQAVSSSVGACISTCDGVGGDCCGVDDIGYSTGACHAVGDAVDTEGTGIDGGGAATGVEGGSNCAVGGVGCRTRSCHVDSGTGISCVVAGDTGAARATVDVIPTISGVVSAGDTDSLGACMSTHAHDTQLTSVAAGDGVGSCTGFTTSSIYAGTDDVTATSTGTAVASPASAAAAADVDTRTGITDTDDTGSDVASTICAGNAAPGAGGARSDSCPDIPTPTDDNYTPNQIQFTPTSKEPVVLVTGATGFVGSYVTRSLLAHGWRVICLIRDRSIVTSSHLATKMAEHAYIGYDMGFGSYESSKLLLVYGNISDAGLGLSDADLSKIAALNVRVIVHCAGVVDTLAPYSTQKNVNVAGVKHIIQFAGSISPCHPTVITMSSSAALAPIGTPDSDDVTTWKESLTSPLPVSTVRSLHTKELYGGTYEGYMQSKWVGERLAWEAHARGLHTCILRPSFIAPSAHALKIAPRTAGLTFPLLDALVLSQQHLNCLPTMAPTDTISWIGVDTLAERVALLVGMANENPEQVDGKAIHLVRTPVSLVDLIARYRRLIDGAGGTGIGVGVDVSADVVNSRTGYGADVIADVIAMAGVRSAHDIAEFGDVNSVGDDRSIQADDNGNIHNDGYIGFDFDTKNPLNTKLSMVPTDEWKDLLRAFVNQAINGVHAGIDQINSNNMKLGNVELAAKWQSLCIVPHGLDGILGLCERPLESEMFEDTAEASVCDLLELVNVLLCARLAL